MQRASHAPLLDRAAEILGSEIRVQAFLQATAEDMQRWRAGEQPLPQHLFLKAVDLVSARQLAPHRRLDAAKQEAMQAALDAALSIIGTDLGNLQLVDLSGVLRIEAQRGFSQPFLKFFERVPAGPGSACGVALSGGSQTIVEDVEASPTFAGLRAGDVMLEAGARAVVSTPMIHPRGAIVGMLSTHFREKGRPSAAELALLAEIAAHAASSLEPGSEP
jgi:GAF domain-containing protein